MVHTSHVVATIEKLLDAVLSVGFTLRLYNEDQSRLLRSRESGVGSQ
jgi:hypothetical protein